MMPPYSSMAYISSAVRCITDTLRCASEAAKSSMSVDIVLDWGCMLLFTPVITISLNLILHLQQIKEKTTKALV
jgi:hypothetical protein